METVKTVYKIFIKGRIKDVWREITRTNEPLPFFFNSSMHTTELGEGAPLRMRTPSGKYTGVVGEVLEFDPPHRFSHTFKFTQLDDPYCKVTYELKEVSGGVDFTLISEDLVPGSKTEKYMKQGEEIIGTTLKALVEKRPLPVKSRFILLMCKWTEFMTPKKSLTTNWPLNK